MSRELVPRPAYSAVHYDASGWMHGKVRRRPLHDGRGVYRKQALLAADQPTLDITQRDMKELPAVHRRDLLVLCVAAHAHCGPAEAFPVT